MLNTEDLIDLSRELQRASFSISTQQILAARRVIDELYAVDEAVPTMRLQTLLAPIFCTTPDEQRNFASLYQDWQEQRFEKPLQSTAEKQRTATTTEPTEYKNWRGVIRTAIVALCLVGSWVLWQEFRTGESTGPGNLEPSPGQQPTPQPLIQLREAAGSQAVRLDPLLRLNATDLVPPPPWWQRLLWGNILLSLLPILGWIALMIRRRLRRPVLQRLTSQTPPTLREVVLQGGATALLPSVPLRRFAQSLRRRRFVHSSVLDETKTIEATTHRGGLFLPVFGSRVEPQYLVLIDRTSIDDHQAQLALQIVADLAKSDVLIDHYEFDGDPSLLRSVDSGRVWQRGGNAALVTASALQVSSLEEVLARSSTHRLLLFCAPTLLFDGLTGQPSTWVEQLVTLEERFLFTPEPPERWGRAEWLLEKLGFSIVPLSRAGFLILTEALQSGLLPRPQGTTRATTTQAVYKRTVGRWLERRTPKDDVVTRLCDDLERTLGPDGFLWLAACAVYPEIHWGLTLRLGVGLFANSRDIERLLPRLAPLIWLREAFMPDWLRQALLQRLTTTNADHVRQVLLDILSSVSAATDTSFSLQIASDPPQTKLSWWKQLRNWWVKRRRASTLIREAPQGSPLQDYVFVRFLSGKRLTALTPTAPRAFLRALFPRGHSWLGWRPWLSFTACLLLSSGLAFLFSPIEQLDSDSFVLHATSFSPDGKTLASVVGEFVVLTDVATGKEIARLSYDDRSDVAVLSPDGRYIVNGNRDRTIRVSELPSGKEVARITHDTGVTAVAVSPDGRYEISGSDDKAVQVRELITGREVARMTYDTSVKAVAISPDGQTLAAMTRQSLQLYRFTSGPSPSRSIAFLVGNNDSGTGAQLAGPVPDVRAVGPALESLGFQVFKFENASQTQIRQAFADLKRQLRPEDRLLVFLSGFGATQSTRAGERFIFVAPPGNETNAPDRKDQFSSSAFPKLVLVNGEPNAPAGKDKGNVREAPDTSRYIEGINGFELATFFRDIPVTQALLVVDASAAQTLATMQQQYAPSSQEARARFLLISYTEDHPMDHPKGSPFALAFAAALQEMRQSTSGKELFNEIAQRMARTGDKQRPSYGPFQAGGHVSGDFQFVVPDSQRQQPSSSNVSPRQQQNRENIQRQGIPNANAPYEEQQQMAE